MQFRMSLHMSTVVFHRDMLSRFFFPSIQKQQQDRFLFVRHRGVYRHGDLFVENSVTMIDLV